MRNALYGFFGFRYKTAVLIPLLLIQLAAVDFISYKYDLFSMLNEAKADMSGSWYDESWKYRKEIVIDHTKVEGGTFTDYAFLFSVPDADLKDISNGGKVG